LTVGDLIEKAMNDKEMQQAKIDSRNRYAALLNDDHEDEHDPDDANEEDLRNNLKNEPQSETIASSICCVQNNSFCNGYCTHMSPELKHAQPMQSRERVAVPADEAMRAETATDLGDVTRNEPLQAGSATTEDTKYLPDGLRVVSHGPQGEKSFVIHDLEAFCSSVTVDNSISVLDDYDQAIMPCEDDEVIVEVTMDSGSIDHVMNDEEAPYIAVVESKRSREGRHYAGANGDAIKNEGEMHMKMQDPDADFPPLNAVFQSAKVTRPLCSVSKICDSHPSVKVSFDSKVCLVTKGDNTLAKFNRRGGLYVCRMKIRKGAGERDKAAGFTRPDAQR
jgi:hypothetical protein